MSIAVREAGIADRDAIRAIEQAAFGGPVEAGLVDALVADDDVVLETVASLDGEIVGHLLFSRLVVEIDGAPFQAVALAPLAVDPAHQRSGIGTALVEDAHRRLRASGETLAVVLGDPGYYGRFGYGHARAAGFDSDYQCDALQALAFGGAPETGRLVYARAFAGLG
jgi:putative acetyltransferase